MTTYTCKECGKPVERGKDGAFVHNCSCNAPIIADMKATATGEASVARGK
jgi:endogenous inhibitor of DNA gyrase (YacG/DUF329 family)